jgi:xylulokinase
MGLVPGIPVSTGGQDQKCAAFGAGLSSGGIAVSLGTSAAITAVFDRPVLMEDMGIPCFPYIYGGKWVLEGFCSNAGGALKWFRDNVVPGKSYAGIDRDIGNNPAGALVSGGLLFMPNMSGTSTPEWYGGGGGGFIGLTLDSTPAQMAASIMEGVAFVIRNNILKMEAYGDPVKEILVFGGGAGSRIWPEIISSVTGRTVMVPNTKETACAGAALMAGNSVGIFSLNEEGEYERLTGRERFTAVEPDMDARGFYDAKYMRFRDMQARIYGGG